MRISELIEKLKEYPAEYEVLIDIEGIDIEESIPILLINSIQPDAMNGFLYLGTEQQKREK